MDSILKKGLFLVTITGAIASFPVTASAADTDAAGIMPSVELRRY